MSTNIQKVKNSMMEAPLVGATGLTGATGAFTTVAGTITTKLAGTGVSKTFTINGYNGSNPDSYSVSVSGIDQIPGTNYTVEAHPTESGKGLLTFSSAPAISEGILVRSFISGLSSTPAEYTGLLNPPIREKASVTAQGTDQPGFAKGEMLLNLNSSQIFILQGTNSDYSINVTPPQTFNPAETASFSVILKAYTGVGTKIFTGFKIDGTTQSLHWIDGAAPTSGNSTGIDVFTFTIIKNVDASYTVFANRANYVIPI